jgi:hypothetical protein
MAAAEDSVHPTPEGSPAFPLYRRTPDGRHFYRIEAPDRFTEIQVVGNRKLVHTVMASAYPERVRVMEMLAGGDGRYLPMDGPEWEEYFTHR